MAHACILLVAACCTIWSFRGRRTRDARACWGCSLPERGAAGPAGKAQLVICARPASPADGGALPGRTAASVVEKRGAAASRPSACPRCRYIASDSSAARDSPLPARGARAEGALPRAAGAVACASSSAPKKIAGACTRGQNSRHLLSPLRYRSVFVSGGGSNFKAVHAATLDGRVNGRVVVRQRQRQ